MTSATSPSSQRPGKVYLVGAGPGDPGLITLRGKYLLEHAEVVVYDYLASPKLLNYVPKNAQFIYAGKKGGGLHAFTQDGINKLLVEHAKLGKMVVRLKGGDPFIFGRGAEEIQELVAEGGPEAATVRAIAARAGVTPGLIRHYFQSKDELTRAAYRALMDGMTAKGSDALEGVGAQPEERLAAFVAAYQTSITGIGA